MHYVVYLLGQIGHFLVQAAHLGGDRRHYRASDDYNDEQPHRKVTGLKTDVHENHIPIKSIFHCFAAVPNGIPHFPESPTFFQCGLTSLFSLLMFCLTSSVSMSIFELT